MKPALRPAFFALAVALLAIALARPLQVWLFPPRFTDRSPAVAAKPGDPATFAQERDAVLDRLRDLQHRGDHAAVLALATPYYRLADPALTELYQASANAEGARLRLEDARQMLGRECVEPRINDHAKAALAEANTGKIPGTPRPLMLRRLAASEGQAAVAAYLKGFAAEQASPSSDHGHDAHGPPRLHPDYLAVLAGAKPPPEDLICVWSLEPGDRKAMPGAARPLTLWLAPSATGRSVEAAIVSPSH